MENKISSIVVDNYSTNDAMMKILLENFDKKSLMLGSDFLHMCCSAHILNLVVQDGLDVIKSCIEEVRECVSFWMSTPKRIEKFEEACRFLNSSNSKRSRGNIASKSIGDGDEDEYAQAKKTKKRKDLDDKIDDDMEEY
uniref:Transposase n=1 Tax=Chenopodium quinoa TaxID=63459 RepID=A0A803MP57_CHEQI